MDMTEYPRFFLSLVFVLGLIWGIAFLLKRFGLDKRLRGATGQTARLQVMDVLYMDTKRKLVLARADANEYLLMVAGDTVTLIDKLGEKKTDA